MPASKPTNIKVFVQWDDTPVYAGEEVCCKITFTNVAPRAGSERAKHGGSSSNGSRATAERQQGSGRGIPSQLHTKAGASRAARPAARGHQHSMSLSVPRAASMAQPGSGSVRPRSDQPGNKGHGHQRSVSIISLGAGSEAGRAQAESPGGPRSAYRPARNHGRSASVQLIPKRSGTLNGGLVSSGKVMNLSGASLHLTVVYSDGQPVGGTALFSSLLPSDGKEPRYAGSTWT